MNPEETIEYGIVMDFQHELSEEYLLVRINDYDSEKIFNEHLKKAIKMTTAKLISGNIKPEVSQIDSILDELCLCEDILVETKKEKYRLENEYDILKKLDEYLCFKTKNMQHNYKGCSFLQIGLSNIINQTSHNPQSIADGIFNFSAKMESNLFDNQLKKILHS